MRRDRLIAIGSLAILSVIAVSGASHADRAVAFEGDAAPGSGGGVFSFFGPPALNDLERVAFRAQMTGGMSSEGIFLDSGAGVAAVAVIGDAAPVVGGGTFFDFGEAAIDDSGVVAFSARLTGGTASRGIFLYDSGVLSPLVTTQSLAPGTGGGNYSAFGNSISVNDVGEVAFFANVGGGTTTGGIFVEDGVAGRAVFLAGDPAPSGVAGTFFALSDPGINAAGEVAVTATISLDAGGFTSGVFVKTATGERIAALVGDAAPGVGSGTYSNFNFSSAPGINASGDVFFRSTVSFGTAARGLFVDSAGVDSAVVLEGDDAPDTGGASFFQFSDSGLSVNDSGDVGYSAGLLGGSVAQGLFLSSVAEASEAVALLGGGAPDAGSATYFLLTNSPAINATATAAFQASLTGGTATSGVFVVPEPGGAAPWIAIAVLVSSARRARARGGRTTRVVGAAALRVR